MKFVAYKGYQITTELYGLGFTWMYRRNGIPTQQPRVKGQILSYSTRNMAIQAAKEEIDKL